MNKIKSSKKAWKENRSGPKSTPNASTEPSHLGCERFHLQEKGDVESINKTMKRLKMANK